METSDLCHAARRSQMLWAGSGRRVVGFRPQACRSFEQGPWRSRRCTLAARQTLPSREGGGRTMTEKMSAGFTGLSFMRTSTWPCARVQAAAAVLR